MVSKVNRIKTMLLHPYMKGTSQGLSECLVLRKILVVFHRDFFFNKWIWQIVEVRERDGLNLENSPKIKRKEHSDRKYWQRVGLR